MNLKDYKPWTPDRSGVGDFGAGPRLVGWRYAMFITVAVGVVGLAAYPTIIAPMMDNSKWKNIQKETRKDVDQEKIQPGGMRVWSDPFKPVPEKDRHKEHER